MGRTPRVNQNSFIRFFDEFKAHVKDFTSNIVEILGQIFVFLKNESCFDVYF